MQYGFPNTQFPTQGTEPTNLPYQKCPVAQNPTFVQPMAQPVQMCGCNPCPTALPTEMFCNQVVQQCFVEEVPHIINYNTHVVNNCVKKHVTIPRYTQTEETVLIDEYVTRPQQFGFGQPAGYGYNVNNNPFWF